MNLSSLAIWLQFTTCVVLIAVAGVQLTRYGDAIADKTGLGGTWIGLILLASVTSLPELAVGVSAVTAADVPDIAAGDVLGSCVYNLALLAVLDGLKGGVPIYAQAGREHILSAGFSIILLGVVGFGLTVSGYGISVSLSSVGVYSLLIALFYAAAMRTIFRYEKEHVREFADQEPDRYPGLSLRRAASRYAVAACVVIAAGIWLPFVSAQLAQRMGWYESFVGTLFTAFVTSLPELVVTISATRIGALDMAIGNIFGSNLFNVLIIAIDDLCYTEAPLLSAVSPIHLVSVMSAIAMSGAVIVGLYVRPRSGVLKTFGWASIFVVAIYLLNSWVLFLEGGKA
jgi:cation:H+ antiporter